MMHSITALALGLLPAAQDARDLAKLPANSWTEVHREDGSGGKAFARAVYAENVGRVYLWGTGGKKPARNVYLRYELERFDPTAPAWTPAFPDSRADVWTAAKFPPFRIYGQSGPDGLKYDEGPRQKVVGGYHAVNRIQWWDFDGVRRPSPVLTFNQACWDSKRNRVVYFADGALFALDPKTHTWTDLKPENWPTTCRTVAWASLSYDPGNDRILLFGGGLATNPAGAAPTWLYDCATNSWARPKLDDEPPPRCTAPIVYDPRNRVMVLFGGNDQSAALNDTWVFDGAWTKRTPKRAPPPMFDPATVPLPGGKVLVCGYDARKMRRNNMSRTSATKETWVYDVAGNAWTPVNGELSLPGTRWLTACRSPLPNVVLLVAFGSDRRTFGLRYDPAAPAADLDGAEPGTVAWKYPEQKESLEKAPPAEPKKQKALLAGLPANEFVDANPPGMLISKTWSTAVVDPHRSEVIYVGGGHSGYSGNDFARYRIADNRWALDQPPRFPPYLEGTNAGIFGWSYGRMPFSQHTYLWYGYDPVSRTIVYLARPSIFDGVVVQPGDDPADVFVYDAKKHGYASWVYDPAERKMRPPSFGRPFKNEWHLTLAGTPKGVFAAVRNRLHRATVDRDSGKVEWTLVDRTFPKPPKPIKYHYEFQPLLHDARRDRLIQLKGDDSRVDVYVRSLDEGGTWSLLETTGRAAIGREAMVVEKHDVVLWLGKKLHVLDLKTNRMAELDVALPKGLYTHECAMVYDPAHDVCVALIPRSFSGPMGTYLFRFDPASAKTRSE